MNQITEPLSLPPLSVGPDANRFMIAQTQAVNKFLSEAHSREETATHLVDFVFAHHPYLLDLPPHMNVRYQAATDAMTRFPNGKEALTKAVLGHFDMAHRTCEEGYVLAACATPATENWNGMWAERVFLPNAIRDRTLAINRFVQTEIQAGKLDSLIGSGPQWTLMKLADGAWLPVGNLMIEVTQGVARIRTPHHDAHNLTGRWGFSASGDFVDLDRWVVMTHIIDKGLLKVLSGISEPTVPMVNAMKLTRAVYVRSYGEIISLMDRNPDINIAGILSDATWIYDPNLKELFPEQEVANLSEVAGDIVVLGTAEELRMPAQIGFATGDPVRRQARESGKFSVRIASRFIDRKGMELAMQRHAPQTNTVSESGGV